MSLRLYFVRCIFCVILYLLIRLFFLLLFFGRNNETDETNFLFEIEEASLSTNVYNEKPVYMGIQSSPYESNYQKENKLLLKKVSNTCKKYNLNTPLKGQHFLYSSNHKSLYCWIRKVASTTFTTLFSKLQNHRNINSLASSYLEELQQLINDSSVFKLLVVRHPFERLVSSYRDRIEDNTKYTAQAWIYTQQIYYLTRPNLFYSNTKTGNSLQKIFTHDRRLKIVPTFKEFVEWLLHESPEHDDVHWNKYYTHCAACNINYSFILKLDYYTSDQIHYIFSKFKIDENTISLPNLKQSKGGHTNFELTCKYFQNLTNDTILKLYERYKIDFEMYDYNLDEYLQCKSKFVKT